MREYPAYKASGVEWLGEIPKHWIIGKAKRVLNVLTDFTSNGSFADLAKNVNYLDQPSYSRLVRLTDLRANLKNKGIYVSKDAHEYLSKSELYGGEILMANVGAYAGFVCLVPKINFKATLAPNMFLLKFNEEIVSNQYAFILFGADFYYNLLINKALSSAQPKLNKEDVKSIDLIFPPTFEEQQSIINFLDYKTGLIDKFIANRQKQQQLLKEQKAALINKAVTKGINPNAKMKPSGIEWIGDVPEEWQLMKLKFTAKMMRGKFSHRPRNDARLYGGKYPFIQTGDVTKTEKYISTYSQTLNEWGYSVSKEFPCGTVVITISANIGDIAILNFNGCFPDSVVGFFSNTNVNEYLFYLLKSMKYVFISESIEGTQLNLNVERLSSIKVALPEPMEQQAILDFIKTETATIDTLITKYQKQIELMQEYRTALISQAVTGKIDVRGWQPKKTISPIKTDVQS